MYVLWLKSDHAVLIGRMEKVTSHTSHRNVGRFRNPKQLEVLLRPLMRCYSVAGIPPVVFRRSKNFLSKKPKDSRDLQATDHPTVRLKVQLVNYDFHIELTTKKWFFEYNVLIFLLRSYPCACPLGTVKRASPVLR